MRWHTIIRTAVLATAFFFTAVSWVLAQYTDSPLPGVMGIWTGGNVSGAAVFTGDNASGTGTVRIRPSDEDTQLVLCEAGNNASPEVCSVNQHVNFSTTVSYDVQSTNSYVDSGGGFNRYNTSFGVARQYTQASSTQGSNAWVADVFSTNGTQSGNASLSVTGVGTATFATGTAGTVTNDFRGPITNGGSATCNGILAGYECHNDDALFYSTSGTVSTMATSTSSITGVVFYNAAGSQAGLVAYGNSTVSDADYASRFLLRSSGDIISLNRIDDVAAGSVHTEFRDNGAGTGVVLADILGNGTVRPLLYGSQTDCTDNAGAAACGAAPTGAVVLDDGSTTVVVSTTAVTANSTIDVNFDPSLGTKLGITCNTTQTFPYVSARTAGTSFTITSADPAGTNKACFSYSIVN